ncbi:bifunctional 3-hydroxydecanoyl-ACP dehydratase/trans-2-decenoyl-ACP isomerase [Candidatus Endolissoclinum faulkneri]|uniref:bifunctional 3-hydroxydecanoyl-ACP dehydratase/trans-2-decenoyl-ACP isomerase n=1 Tax=Candidatus Endolissoclinum faulkneri TaxID=1263979 RepID=UPI00046D1208|nr:bifunctional 3-hydroxydecanoyl-ACP dehydratase/trans-2-decenoyl-ACP isomerase [Candidatus Endolissoclinum faulkneri]
MDAVFTIRVTDQRTARPVLEPKKRSSFSYNDLLECAHGRLFGPGNARLPLPPMLMFDRITHIAEVGGANDKGEVEAELDIRPDLWFFLCHFENDPVMPGCLGMDALWQLLGFMLGWLGGHGAGRAISACEVKFIGQIVPTAKKVRYHLDLKRIISRKLFLGIADGWVDCDDVRVFEAKDIRVGLFANIAAAVA